MENEIKDIIKEFANPTEETLNDAVKRICALFNVVGQSEQLPNMTLEQAIEKAKPNLDKIKDVDKHIDDIR